MVEAAGIEPVALNRSGLSKNAHSGLVVNIDVGALAHLQGYSQSIRNWILEFFRLPPEVHFNFDGVPADKRFRLLPCKHCVLNLFSRPGHWSFAQESPREQRLMGEVLTRDVGCRSDRGEWISPGQQWY